MESPSSRRVTLSRSEEWSAGLVRAEIDLAVVDVLAVVRSREITGEVSRQR